MCGKPSKAKGLCGTHYARLRRTGSPTGVRKPGPKRNPVRAGAHAAMGSDFGSPRTFARFDRAVALLNYAGADAGEAIERATRPNGTVNISRLLRIAEVGLMSALIAKRAYEEEGRP